MKPLDTTPHTSSGDKIEKWLTDNPDEARAIAYQAIAGLYLEEEGGDILPEDDCYPRGSGSDYVDEVGDALTRSGIMPLIQKLQAEESGKCHPDVTSVAHCPKSENLCSDR